MSIEEIKEWRKEYPEICQRDGLWQAPPGHYDVPAGDQLLKAIRNIDILLSSLETKDKEIEKVKKEVEKSISFLAAPDMKWDQAMRILFKIVGKEYQF